MRPMFLLLGILSSSLLLTTTSLSQWTQTNGPEGGYTNVIFSDPTSGYIFAGGNGFNKSNMNGATWTAANTGMDGIASPVAVVRSAAGLFAASLDKMYFSSDNGNSWTLRSTVPAQVLSMGVVGSTLVVGTNVFGVYRSTNDGVSWTTVSGFPPSNNIVQTIASVGTRLLAGLGGKGVWASTDNGATWSQSSTGLGNTRSVNGLAVHGSSVFAATSDSAILVSANSGINWTSSSTGMNPRASVNAIGSNGTVLFASVVGAYSGVDTGVVYRSLDNGASWASVKSGLDGSRQNCIGFGTAGKVFSGSGIGIYATTNNGANWFASNTGLRNANALALTVMGSTLFAGYAGGISKTQDEGATWTVANNGVPPNTGVVAMTTHDSYVFAGSGIGVLRSGDNGASWVPMNNGLTGFALYVSAMAAGGSYVFIGGTLGDVYVSSDNGGNWVGPSTGLPSFAGVNTLFVDGTTLWAGIQSNGVYRSTNNGATWTASSTGLPAFGANVSSITRNGSNLFAGLAGASGSTVYISTNNGANWTASSNGIPASSYCFTLFSIGQFVFAGFNYSGTGVASGIYRTSDNGANWAPVNTGLPAPCSINAIAVMGTSMYASYIGVWKRSLSQIMSVKEIGTALPESFALEQNYPNPFNPTTNIRFRIADFGFVSLKVFDILGREVATLIHEQMEPRSYEATFDAVRLSSGIYFYTLQTGSSKQTRKLILMK